VNSKLHVRLFGGFHITYDDKPVDIMHSMRMQSLLAYLILHRGTPQSRQYLAFTFWPDSSESQALTNLRQSLHHLRKAIPGIDTYLHVDNRNIIWKNGTPLLMDVAEFERHIDRAKNLEKNKETENGVKHMEQAIECYRGDLFPACYDAWIEPYRQKMKDDFIDALCRIMDYYESQLNYQRAIYYGERLLVSDNLREKSYVDLMRLHALNNDRGSLVKIYQECKRILKNELDIEPGPETREMYERMITDSDALSENTGVQEISSLSQELPLIGRRDEWRLLISEWEKVVSGAIRFVCITGEPGIGKTRLGIELFDYVGKLGYVTAYSRSYEAAGDLSYGPVSEWLKEPGIYENLKGLDQLWLQELTRLVPELLVEDPTLRSPGPLNEKWQRRNLFQAITRAILPQEKATLLFLDDLQWCDRETLEWLGFVFHSKEVKNFLVLATLRPVESITNKQLQNLLEDLRREENITEIHIKGLNSLESYELASIVAGENISTYPDVYNESEGNPLFVIELIRQGYFRDKQSVFVQRRAMDTSLVGTDIDTILLPPKVNNIISARFEQLTEKTRELMWLAAAIGREFRYEVLVRASEWEEKTIIASLEELLVHQIIRELNTGIYDFSHDKIREVAYRSMSNARRRLLHKQIARALESVYSAELKRYSRQLAYHYDRAGIIVPAIKFYNKAAKNARAIFANEESVALIQRALDLLGHVQEGADRDRLELELQSGLALTMIHINGYGSNEVFDACSRVFILCEKLNESPSVTIKRIFALANLCVARFDDAYVLGKELYDHARATGDNIELVEACYLLGSVLFRKAKYNEATMYYEMGLSYYDPQNLQLHIDRFGQDPYTICMVRLSKIALLLGDKHKSDSLAAEALKRAYRINHPFTLDYIRTDIAWNHIIYYNYDEALKMSDEVLASSYDYEFPFWTSICEIYYGWSRCHQGFTDEGIRRMREGLTLSETMNLPDLPYFHTLFAEAMVQNGEPEEALTLVDRALEQIEKTESRWIEPEVYRIRGEILRKIHPSNPEPARKSFQKAIEIAHIQQVPLFEKRALRALKNVE
jgi:DNA-binding SARP family transcriptional activator/predicted ATPase